MGKPSSNQKKEAQTQILALVAALILAAVLASGCSTPPVQGSINTNEAPAVDSTNYVSNSYLQCVNVMTSYGLQQQCYQVGSPYATSYSQYSYTKTGFAKGVSEANMQAAYASYLSTLDPQTQSELSARYDAIVAAYTK